MKEDKEDKEDKKKEVDLSLKGELGFLVLLGYMRFFFVRLFMISPWLFLYYWIFF